MKSILDYLKTQDSKQNQTIAGIGNMINEFIPALNSQTSALQTFIQQALTGVVTETALQQIITSRLNTSTKLPLDMYMNPTYNWQKVGPTSHTPVRSLTTSSDGTTLVDISGAGLIVGMFNHTWLNYNESGTSATVSYKIIVDGRVIDYYTITRGRYDTVIAYGDVSGDTITIPTVYSASSVRTMTGTSRTNVSSTYLVDIGSFIAFEQSVKVVAYYSGTPSTSDSIYSFDVGVRLLSNS